MRFCFRIWFPCSSIILTFHSQYSPAAQTDAVLRQAMRENVLVTLFLNKVDKALSLLPPDDLYDTLERSIDSVNASLNGVQAPLSFKQGTVALGSAYEGWFVFCLLILS